MGIGVDIRMSKLVDLEHSQGADHVHEGCVWKLISTKETLTELIVRWTRTDVVAGAENSLHDDRRSNRVH